MLILMRFSTGEDWNEFMYDYSNMKDCKVSVINFKYFDLYNNILDEPNVPRHL